MIINKEKTAIAQKLFVKDFNKQIDDYKNGVLPTGELLYLGPTPKILQKIGLPNNPITLKQGKLKKLVSYNKYNDRYHNIPYNLIKKIPKAISTSLYILKSSSNNDSIVIITNLSNNNKPIIVSIKINSVGQIGNIKFLTNLLTSAYGKDNFRMFLQREIAKGNLLYSNDHEKRVTHC